MALSSGATVKEVVVSQSGTIETAQRNATINVVGSGHAERTADYATITGTIEAEAPDQLGALKAMSAQRDQAEDALMRLADTKHMEIETGEIAFHPIRPPGCDESEESRPMPSKGKCAPIAVQASVKLTVTVRPAEKIGAAASLAVQLGLKDVQLGEAGVDDEKALQAEAMRSAYDDAHRQAELLAKAAGRRLGPLLQLGRAPYPEPGVAVDAFAADAKAEGLIGPPPITPDVALKLTTPKVSRNSVVVASFALEN
jgi:uncharacterized protein YggE